MVVDGTVRRGCSVQKTHTTVQLSSRCGLSLFFVPETAAVYIIARASPTVLRGDADAPGPDLLLRAHAGAVVPVRGAGPASRAYLGCSRTVRGAMLDRHPPAAVLCAARVCSRGAGHRCRGTGDAIALTPGALPRLPRGGEWTGAGERVWGRHSP